MQRVDCWCFVHVGSSFKYEEVKVRVGQGGYDYKLVNYKPAWVRPRVIVSIDHVLAERSLAAYVVQKGMTLRQQATCKIANLMTENKVVVQLKIISIKPSHFVFLISSNFHTHQL